MKYCPYCLLWPPILTMHSSLICISSRHIHSKCTLFYIAGHLLEDPSIRYRIYLRSSCWISSETYILPWINDSLSDPTCMIWLLYRFYIFTWSPALAVLSRPIATFLTKSLTTMRCEVSCKIIVLFSPCKVIRLGNSRPKSYSLLVKFTMLLLICICFSHVCTNQLFILTYIFLKLPLDPKCLFSKNSTR